MERFFKCCLSAVIGFFAALTKQYGIVFGFVAFGITFDFVTGIIKCKVTGEKLSSRRGFKGFWKKMSLLMAMCFGVFLDFFIPLSLEKIVSAELPFNLPFGLIVGTYITLNESISICENLYECNPDIIPKWVAGLLKNAKNKIDDENG